MSRLFDRRWRVTLGNVEFETLDCDFSVQKSLKIEPNTCSLTVFNLNRDHQAQLEELRPKDKAATSGIPCRIEAGYVGPGPQLIWLGDLRTIETVKDGPDWVTSCTSGDGAKAWKNAAIHIAFGPKTPLETALRAIVREMGVPLGNLAKVVQQLKQAGTSNFPCGKVYSGSAARALMDFARSADLEVSVQDGALQFLNRGKALEGTSVLLNAQTGLIGSPTVDQDGIVTVSTLMIPDIRMGGLVTIEAERVKGTYRVIEGDCAGSTRGDAWGWTLRGERY